jgi:hypothetical protein
MARRRGDKRAFSPHEERNKCFLLVTTWLPEEVMKRFLEDMWIGKRVMTKSFSTRCVVVNGWSSAVV